MSVKGEGTVHCILATEDTEASEVKKNEIFSVFSVISVAKRV